MNALCIKQSTRPNLHKLSESNLIDIINEYEPKWICDKKKHENFRDELVAKVFNLWSEYELKDNNSNSIECLICWDKLTNGNNMTFDCGHKFHSNCIIKSLLCFSTDTYIDKINNKEIEKFKIEYCCPQCKRPIDSIDFDKK